MKRRYTPLEVRRAMRGPLPPSGRWTHPVVVSALVLVLPFLLTLAVYVYFEVARPTDEEHELGRQRMMEVSRLVLAEYHRTGEAPVSLLDVPGVPPEYFEPGARPIRINPVIFETRRRDFTAEFTDRPGFWLWARVDLSAEPGQEGPDDIIISPRWRP